MHIKINRIVTLALVAMLSVGCSSRPQFEIEPPIDNTVLSEPGVTFTVTGRRDVDRVVPQLDKTPLAGISLESLKLYRLEKGSLVSQAFRVSENAIVSAFSPGTRYLLHGPFGVNTTNRYDLLCRVTQFDFERLVDDPRMIDPICTRILCPADPYFADELIREFPLLEREPELFPEEELRDIQILPRQQRAAPGNICDQCLGRDWPGGVLVPDCPPRQLPRPRLRGRIINIVPKDMSGETNQDSEPNVSVDPENHSHVVASAFTPNPTGTGNAPIYISEDAGNTWELNPIVQSNVMTSDITVRFTRTTGTVYAGILRRPGGLRMSIQSTDDFTDATPMTIHVDRQPNAAGLGPDQPYVAATDVDSKDRVYVGNNDLAVVPQTASIDQTVDDAANWTTQRLESRPTVNQDLPPVRPAIGTDNVIYAAYIAIRTGGSEVVVVRDDNGATGATTYQSLTGADGNPGVRVITGITVPFENFAHDDLGQERLVASDLSIAVDPNDSSRVCVAWGSRVASEVITTHLRCSVDSGQNWDTSDRRTLTNTKNPALAFNKSGHLGFLYQSVRSTSRGDRWFTSFDVFDSSFQRITTAVLARTPADAPLPQFLPYIGDYVHLLALGDEFHGIFSANNTPDSVNFPLGVTYQRAADFGTQTLLDLSENPVDVSIDPFYFVLRLENK